MKSLGIQLHCGGLNLQSSSMFIFEKHFNLSSFVTGLCEDNASLGRMTYVHCKAGRGRSTTIVLCYLVCILAVILI